MDGCSIWSCMGSNKLSAAITRGDSNTAVIARLVARAWEFVQRRAIRARSHAPHPS